MNSRMCPPDLKGLLNGVVGASRSPNPPLMGYTDMRRAAFSAWSSLMRILTSFRAVLAGEPIKDLLLMLSTNFLILEEFFKGLVVWTLSYCDFRAIATLESVSERPELVRSRVRRSTGCNRGSNSRIPSPADDDDDLSGRAGKNAVTGESVIVTHHPTTTTTIHESMTHICCKGSLTNQIFQNARASLY